MQYRDFGKTGIKVSALGYGCMRFQTVGGKVNPEFAKEQILLAIENGVNYFDTAYIYNGGKNESILGKILSDNQLRQKVYIADKLPPFLVRTREDIEKYL